jgi:hypothetical protein
MKADAKPRLVKRFWIKSQYSTAFLDVARNIAKADPPLWLLVGLTHFSAGIGSDKAKYRQQFDRIVGDMSDAVNVLLEWLPIYRQLGFGAQCPDEIKVALAILPKIKAELDQLGSPPHRPKNANREICAAVVVEASRLLHGNVARRSEQLYEACNDYWRACGGDEIGETGDRLNWRRAVETSKQPWIRKILSAIKAQPELDRPAVQNSI